MASSWVLDCDGVVWLADRPLPGAASAISELRESGIHVGFVTNYSGATIDTLVKKFESMGIFVNENDIITSSAAAASLLNPAERVIVCGGPGINDAVEAAGASVVDGEEADVVVVGLSFDVTYASLQAASTAILNGARFIATNTDPQYPTPGGPLPGGGAIVAFLECATGKEAVVAGKPYQPIADVITRRWGTTDMVVGDRKGTDGGLAERLGATFGFITTSGLRDEGGAESEVHAPSLLELVSTVLDTDRSGQQF